MVMVVYIMITITVVMVVTEAIMVATTVVMAVTIQGIHRMLVSILCPITEEKEQVHFHPDGMIMYQVASHQEGMLHLSVPQETPVLVAEVLMVLNQLQLIPEEQGQAMLNLSRQYPQQAGSLARNL